MTHCLTSLKAFQKITIISIHEESTNKPYTNTYIIPAQYFTESSINVYFGALIVLWISLDIWPKRSISLLYNFYLIPHLKIHVIWLIKSASFDSNYSHKHNFVWAKLGIALHVPYSFHHIILWAHYIFPWYNYTVLQPCNLYPRYFFHQNVCY